MKRFLSVVVMVMAALMLVLGLAGIAGTWMLRGQLATSLEGLATAAEARAEAVQQGLDRLGTTLARAHDGVVSIEQQAQTLGTDLEENKPLLTAISDKLGLELKPLLDKAGEIVTTIQETVAAVNGIVEGINALPFVTSPVADLEKLNQLSQDLDSLVAEVQDLRTALDRRQSEIVRRGVGLVTTPTSQIGTTLDTMQTTVSGYSQEIDRLQEGLSRLRSSLGQGLTWGAVILTLIFVWLAVSQVGLLVLGWRAFLGHDLLPRRDRPVEDLPSSQ